MRAICRLPSIQFTHRRRRRSETQEFRGVGDVNIGHLSISEESTVHMQ